MNLADVFPPKGQPQRLYCDGCKGHLDLAYADFSEEVSGISITINGLPVLRCSRCNRDHLPDWSRFAIIRLWEQASEKGAPAVRVNRQKPSVTYNLTKVSFLYDPDDYRYIPGLERTNDSGFLTPVFFNRRVLMKYETHSEYRVAFASTTYGTIYADEFDISFGINKNGKVLMWLGDIGKLPEAEQYYLRSENVESDHSVGSEFYEGQIDVVFTPPTIENRLFALRSEFVNACLSKFGTKIAHLDEEVLKLAGGFNAPVIDTEKERRHVADTLNKIYVESLDSSALGALMKQASADPGKLGGLKRLQVVLESVAKGADVAAMMSPLFVLYDFRVACLHLGSEAGAKEKLKFVTERLGISEGSGLVEIYQALTAALAVSFEKMTALLRAE